MAFGTDETGHVFDHANNWNFGSLAKCDLLSHVQQTDLLRSGHYYCSGNAAWLEILSDGQVLIGCAWWRVDKKIFELIPIDIT